MNIVFVVGGSYKAFYINNIKKLKGVDLLIFQKDILYEFDYYNEMIGQKTVTNEMLNLASLLDCKIIAIVNTNLFGEKEKEILYADKEKVLLINKKNYLNLLVKEKFVNICFEQIITRGDVLISISNKKSSRMKFSAYNKTIFLCDKAGVKMAKFGKIKRKIRKICYFCLPF